jgi:hypothetical protein
MSPSGPFPHSHCARDSFGRGVLFMGAISRWPCPYGGVAIYDHLAEALMERNLSAELGDASKCSLGSGGDAMTAQG